jgi:Polyketide cyclase / dehydrase and lipid transport
MKICLNLAVNGVLGMLLLAPLQALAEASVQIESKGTALYVQAEIDTTADSKTAWEVLTDYDHWTEFIPDLLVSRVISHPGDPLQLEHRARIPSMPNFPVVMILQVEESPLKRIRFYRTAGNVLSFAGEWLIEGKSRQVHLVYRAVLTPGFPMPPQASMEIFRNDAKVRMEAMAQEMARRMPALPAKTPQKKKYPKKKKRK